MLCCKASLVQLTVLNTVDNCTESELVTEISVTSRSAAIAMYSCQLLKP